MADAQVDPVKEALEKFLPSFPQGPVGTEVVGIEDALGRIAAEDVAADLDSPPYSRSIMEGYVITAGETQRASEQKTVSFEITGEIPPGRADIQSLSPGSACQVVTGSFIPRGDLTVARVFDVERKDNTIFVKRPFKEGENIELQGCDLKKGTITLAKGKRITPSDIGLLAGQGLLKVTVAARPRVAIFSSGNEVLPPTEKLKPGYIWDSNAYALSALVKENGGTPHFRGIIKDDLGFFTGEVKKALGESDMVLISGGTAAGGKDFIKDVISGCGSPGVLVNGVPMRSGKPLIMGVLSQKPIVCVAGHPPEAIRGFDLFGKPALARLLGLKS